MKRDEMVEIFMNAEINNLNISERDKKIVRLYLMQVSIKEISRQFNLSKGRVRDILSKSARFAVVYQKNSNDPEYQKYVEEFRNKRILSQKIKISSMEPDFSKRISALLESCANVDKNGADNEEAEIGKSKEKENKYEE